MILFQKIARTFPERSVWIKGANVSIDFDNSKNFFFEQLMDTIYYLIKIKQKILLKNNTKIE